MTNTKKTIIVLGDILILYGALMLTLIFRYGLNYFRESFYVHLKPFSLIFIIWILIFYLADLYQEKRLRISPATIQVFILAIIISVVSSIILFYLFPSFFKLTPKTNLAIFTLIFGILDLGWRIILVKIYISRGLKDRLLIIGDSPIIDEVINYLKNNPQIGYDVTAQKSENDISQIIAKNKINTIVIQTQLKKEPRFTKIFYQLLASKISIIDLITFYETIFQKLPLEELDESWFIEKITTRRHFYDITKRIIDFCLSLVLIIIFLPLSFIIVFLIKTTSKGPAIYKQERIGLNNKPFILLKFRTMRVNNSGPLWTDKNDKRLTSIGRILRYTHLDEMPQLYNILKGDISFIGPRAERRELVELYKKLPYYDIRHIIKTGLTGWAQVNYKPSASIEEAKEKLKYDIYYIKNRSFILDFLIILNTLKYLFISNH